MGAVLGFQVNMSRQKLVIYALGLALRPLTALGVIVLKQWILGGTIALFQDIAITRR